MNYRVIGGLLLAVATTSVFAEDGKTPLFKFKGKTFTVDDSGPAVKQTIYEVEMERFNKIKQVVDAAVLEKYFEEEANKQKKSVKDVEGKLLGVKDPTDAELKEFYEQNKARVPYKYEEVKDQIKQFLVQQKKQEKKQKLLDDMKKSGQFTALVVEPTPPKIDINISGFPAKGSNDAKVTMVEFADYQCPHCKAAEPAVQKVVEAYKDKVKYVYIDFPINHSGISRIVAEGSVCALEQNKYWEYRKLAFEKQSELAKDSPEKLAGELKLDSAQFKKCLASAKPKEFVEKALNEAQRIGVGGTPTIYVNGMKVSSPTEEAMKQVLDKALKG